MRFPLLDQLAFPCRCSAIIPGKLHSDGRRYLPIIMLEPIGDLGVLTPADFRLAVVDRHHRVAAANVGQVGLARLVYALSTIRLQKEPPRSGLLPEADLPLGHASMAPAVYGQVVGIPTWEVDREHLDYEVFYAELLIQVGSARLGLRTSAGAPNLSHHLGKARLELGDWVEIGRSRIDILAFEPA